MFSATAASGGTTSQQQGGEKEKKKLKEINRLDRDVSRYRNKASLFYTKTNKNNSSVQQQQGKGFVAGFYRDPTVDEFPAVVETSRFGSAKNNEVFAAAMNSCFALPAQAEQKEGEAPKRRREMLICTASRAKSFQLLRVVNPLDTNNNNNNTNNKTQILRAAEIPGSNYPGQFAIHNTYASGSTDKVRETPRLPASFNCTGDLLVLPTPMSKGNSLTVYSLPSSETLRYGYSAKEEILIDAHSLTSDLLHNSSSSSSSSSLKEMKLDVENVKKQVEQQETNKNHQTRLLSCACFSSADPNELAVGCDGSLGVIFIFDLSKNNNNNRNVAKPRLVINTAGFDFDSTTSSASSKPFENDNNNNNKKQEEITTTTTNQVDRLVTLAKYSSSSQKPNLLVFSIHVECRYHHHHDYENDHHEGEGEQKRGGKAKKKIPIVNDISRYIAVCETKTGSILQVYALESNEIDKFFTHECLSTSRLAGNFFVASTIKYGVRFFPIIILEETTEQNENNNNNNNKIIEKEKKRTIVTPMRVNNETTRRIWNAPQNEGLVVEEVKQTPAPTTLSSKLQYYQSVNQHKNKPHGFYSCSVSPNDLYVAFVTTNGTSNFQEHHEVFVVEIATSVKIAHFTSNSVAIPKLLGKFIHSVMFPSFSSSTLCILDSECNVFFLNGFDTRWKEFRKLMLIRFKASRGVMSKAFAEFNVVAGVRNYLRYLDAKLEQLDQSFERHRVETKKAEEQAAKEAADAAAYAAQGPLTNSTLGLKKI